jgi:RecG-like helicase
MGKSQSLLHRLTASVSNLDAAELREEIKQRSCVPMQELRRGTCVQVVGRLRAVVYTPSETVPTLEAELFDGTDSIDLVWLGRRRIAGVEPGRRVVARGRVGEHNGRKAIYNPWYELLPPGA